MSTQLPPSKRVAPHTVAPTTRLLRDSMLHGNPNLYGAIDEFDGNDINDVNTHLSIHATNNYDIIENSDKSSRPPLLYRQWRKIESAVSQLPAIALVTLFHLMVGIPFGVSYFPVGWKSSASAAAAGDDVSTSDGGFVMDGPFPIVGKEALGIRMFLFSTIIGQLTMTYASNFRNCIALQMVENVPFCQSLTYIVIQHQGYGKEALSTLFFLFGLSSLIVGAVFYTLGRLEMGKVLYFFPAHVLVGCIGGIGVFIAKTGLEVTANASFGILLIERIHLLLVVFGFEAGLRVLNHSTKDSSGTSRYPLLSPIYFCLITPVFYLGIWANGKSIETAFNEGYFFPPLDDSGAGGVVSFLAPLWSENTWAIFRVVDFSTISWPAVLESIPTMVALVLFSLIHVPINIPAFAVSTNVDVDMNRELVAHGWSNGIVGLFAGLQNYMAYTQSIIYYKSGGKGRASSLAVAGLTSILFFIGPTVASYMPRAMAGTLLLHCGIDLFLEGVSDSYGKYDYLEYGGIWAITFVMTMFGMEAALLMGAVSALLTYAVQSVTYLSPIRGSMTAATLRSSEWNRSPEAFDVLDSDEHGRVRIKVIQLQGHLFFGNISLFGESVKRIIQSNPAGQLPLIVSSEIVLISD